MTVVPRQYPFGSQSVSKVRKSVACGRGARVDESPEGRRKAEEE